MGRQVRLDACFGHAEDQAQGVTSGLTAIRERGKWFHLESVLLDIKQ